MKQLFYTFRYLIRSRGNNLIKVISLTLGLVVGLVLFSQVAFELSYDNFYPDADRIYSIQRNLTMKDNEAFKYKGPIINAPVPGAMRDDLNEVEDATVISGWQNDMMMKYDDKIYKEKVCIADSSFFDVFGYKILEGDKMKLALSLNMFLSSSAAHRIFGLENPVGKTILLNKTEPVTIAGVFEDIPKNTHLPFDAVLSFKTLTQAWGYHPGWMNNDAYMGYVKLRPNVSAKEVEAKIPGILPKYYDVEAFKAKGIMFDYYLKPVTELHSTDSTIKRMLQILSLLAFSLLFVSAMNYVLISISSLAVRAKSVGVHKCNGASDGNIFAMFIYETFSLVLISFILAIILILIFRGQIESLIQASLINIFSLSNLWVTLVVVVSLLLLAGVIPARIFSIIPVTQVFRTYTANKRYWKRTLLFVQFLGIAFMLTLLVIITKQYSLMINKDLGYTTEYIISAADMGDVSGEQITRLKSEFSRMPEVEKVTITTALPIDGMNGSVVSEQDKEEFLFSSRVMSADKDFIETLRIHLKEGENFSESRLDYNHAIVNETFTQKMHWNEPFVGKTFRLEGETAEVIGVMKDFQIGSLQNEIPPLVMYSKGEMDATWTGSNNLVIRLNDLNPVLLSELNARLRELLNNDDACFIDYSTRITESYKTARLFRNSILSASIIMLIITLLGLLGYTEDEIHRRSKEIAIRKVNGAKAEDILFVISRDVSFTAIPAILIGLMVAYFTGNNWLMQFVVKISMGATLFISCGIVVLAIIIVCVTIRAWRVSNENPVKSIKSE
ncbi:ABC transporter permease [Parabacteroides sp. AM08-6]|uniref:ABC transporter permease n=1 Tax=Parabacteroides sp. AM08-6 TaxID=2292053 RepID=UPI000EFFF14A|nr:ABC transporter permease [Parabacteroides sp. AM08-6]RHJ83469.1 ABC transporter permease [Parabacteroides sp. AM08-6]